MWCSQCLLKALSDQCIETRVFVRWWITENMVLRMSCSKRELGYSCVAEVGDVFIKVGHFTSDAPFPIQG